MISAGNMRHRLTLQSKSATRNSIGEEVVTWADVASVWGEARPIRGKEFYEANQVQQTLDVRFIIRQRFGITTDMRLLWKSVPYDITAVIEGTGGYLGTLELHGLNGARNGR